MSVSVLKFKPVALAVAFAFPSFAFAAAGRIDFAVGDVKALSPDGRTRPLAKGDEFNSGETIETGDGRVWLRFTDGAQVSLQPQSQYRIDNYKYNGQADGEERGFFNLLKGGLRTITGWVGRTNRKNYQVTTAVATIGIRGTEFSITYGNSITVTTAEGEVEVCNTAGCLDLSAGESGYVSSIDSKPILIEKKADLPPTPPLPDPQFSVANNTNGTGGAAIVNPPVLLSGPGYALAYAGLNGIGGVQSGVNGSGQATFDSASQLSPYSSGITTFTAGSVANAGTDGVVGWGRWVTGTIAGGAGVTTVSNLAYVTGIPTPAASMPTTGSASYVMSGGTNPVNNGTGAVGTLTSGSLNVTFGGMPAVSGTIGTSFGTATFAIGYPGPSPFTGSTFAGSDSTNRTFNGVSVGTMRINGFFVGAAASGAAMTYYYEGLPSGGISGAIAFH